MKMKTTLATICLALSFTSIVKADDVIIDKTHFDKVGTLASFQWAPERYETGFRYDIFYYIPKALKDQKNVPSLIFMHGGGASTMDRRGSIDVTKMYAGDLVRLADELGMIVVLPSANGLNWGGHTRGILKDLAAMMKTDLEIDDNRIGVSGHSMGGMGITRIYSWLTDEFAYFIPQASGLEEKLHTEQYLNKTFNVPYVHLQGKNDHFRSFITRCESQLKLTKELEVSYGVPSKLEVNFYNGDHNYNLPLFKSTLSRLMKNPRDLYQKELFGSFDITNRKVVDNNITFHLNSEARYFWLELASVDETVNDRLHFRAKITANTINIDMPVMPKASKELKVYLHSNMVDLNQDVEILLNGQSVAVRKAAPGVLSNMDAKDPGFMFEDVVTIKL